ncbi:hypothetical protein ACH0BF_22495 [Pseudobacillus sp. 179-B 2D1 NHS]
MSYGNFHGYARKAKKSGCGCGWNNYSPKNATSKNQKGKKVIKAYPKK